MMTIGRYGNAMKRKSIEYVKKDTLIALLKYKRDLGIARQQKWYRIPVKSAPNMVRDKTIRYLALYQPKVFGDEAFQVRWYGNVSNISIVTRKDLLPQEKAHPHASEAYYKIDLTELQELPLPIWSRRKRRMLFITTTFERFRQAKELNEAFHESPIEERVWDALNAEQIQAERQYWVQIPERNMFLDFALFCHSRNIDIECDGDAYHTKILDVKRDKKRNNLLESHGWAVLRYTTEEIVFELHRCLSQIKETVNSYGGLQDPIDPTRHRFFGENRHKQLSLFNEPSKA